MKKITITALLSALTLCLITYNSSAMSRMEIAQGRVPGSWVKGAKLSGVAQAAKDPLSALKNAAESIGLDARALEKISNDNPGDQIRLFSEVLSVKGVPVLDVLSGNFNPENYLANQAAQAATSQLSKLKSAAKGIGINVAGLEGIGGNQMDIFANALSRKGIDPSEVLSGDFNLPQYIANQANQAAITKGAADLAQQTGAPAEVIKSLKDLSEEEAREVFNLMPQKSGYWDMAKRGATGALGYIGRPVMAGTSKAAGLVGLGNVTGPQFLANLGQAEKEALAGLGALVAAGGAAYGAYKLLTPRMNLELAIKKLEALDAVIVAEMAQISSKEKIDFKQSAQYYTKELKALEPAFARDRFLSKTNRDNLAPVITGILETIEKLNTAENNNSAAAALAKMQKSIEKLKSALKEELAAQKEATIQQPSYAARARELGSSALESVAGWMPTGERIKSWIPSDESVKRWTTGWSRPSWLGGSTSAPGQATNLLVIPPNVVSQGSLNFSPSAPPLQPGDFPPIPSSTPPDKPKPIKEATTSSIAEMQKALEKVPAIGEDALSQLSKEGRKALEMRSVLPKPLTTPKKDKELHGKRTPRTPSSRFKGTILR